ncbi:hypothetical protein LFM09_33740 [Lentzea alba]|uniref:hypothetical protein n=1 Tax=Lentzea alba TaxID=2714351 RepID=UPI0039BF4B4C
MHRVAYRCDRDGLADTLREGLLGGYDGMGTWTLVLRNIGNGDEQLMVGTHEGLHHEFQASSPFGLVAAMGALLARRGYRASTLDELFESMVEYSTATHETFATTLSASVTGVERARKLLSGNVAYTAHLTRGHALAGPSVLPWRVRETAAAATLRVCMAPAELLELVDNGFGRMPHRLPSRTGCPDDRLAAFERAGGPGGFADLFRDLAAEFPERGIGEGDPDWRHLPDDDELDDLREFEEDVLLRRCYDYAAGVLDDLGLATVPWTEQKPWTEALKGAVAEVDAELAQRLSIVAERRPISDDGLEFDRQNIRLRAPWPAGIVSAEATLASLPSFYSWDVDGDPHVCGVWLSRKIATRQFAFLEGMPPPEPLTALMVPVRTPEGEGTIFGLLPDGCTPQHAQGLLEAVPLLAITTHFTLTDDRVAALLHGAEPVFVLMDLPVAWHVADWIRQGAGVAMGLLPLEGAEDGALWLLAFAVDRAPNCRFLHIGTREAVALLFEQLRRRHGDLLTIGDDMIRQDWGAWNVAVNHVLGAWSVLGQDAAE